MQINMFLKIEKNIETDTYTGGTKSTIYPFSLILVGTTVSNIDYTWSPFGNTVSARGGTHISCSWIVSVTAATIGKMKTQKNYLLLASFESTNLDLSPFAHPKAKEKNLQAATSALKLCDLMIGRG